MLPIVTVESEDEAIALANDSEFGLGASVWTMNRAKGERIAERLESGMVWINDHMFSHGACSCSWGGVKDSGLGRSHSKFGLLGVREHQARHLGALAHPRLLVAPLRRLAGQGDERLGQLLYGRDADKPAALREGAVPAAEGRAPVAQGRLQALRLKSARIADVGASP